MEVCEHCGTELMDQCLRCGAPVCCPRCCSESAAADRIEELVMDKKDAYAEIRRIQAELDAANAEKDGIFVAMSEIAGALEKERDQAKARVAVLESVLSQQAEAMAKGESHE